MLGKRSNEPEMFQFVTMEDLVPANHLLRRLRSALDLSFVREMVASQYSSIGRASVDPDVVVRMLVLQYLYDFSERQVCDEVRMHAGFRWFCGLSFNDKVPDQSTLVKLRNHKWVGTGLWERVLDATVRACEAAGIARPDRMAVDGTQITANASIKSLSEIPAPLTLLSCADPAPESIAAPEPTPPDPPAPLRVEEGDRERGPRSSGDPDWHGERFSNATHRSTTDPEARLYRKGRGQEARLRYLGHYLVDVRSGVIYGAMATQATGCAEREAACALLDRLSVVPDELVMDLGYRDGGFLASVMERGVSPLVGLGHEPLEQEPQWTRRTFDVERQRKRAEALAAARARNAARIAARTAAGRRAQRQRTRIEHLYGEAKEHHGLDRARGRGLCRMDEQVKLTAIVQNLKRLANNRGFRKAMGAIARASVTVPGRYGALLRASRTVYPAIQTRLARFALARGRAPHRAPNRIWQSVGGRKSLSSSRF